MRSLSTRFASGAECFVDRTDELAPALDPALSRLQLPDLRVSLTRRALHYVQFFSRTDRGRQMFATWLKRSGRYQELIRAELRESRLPEDLLWVAMIESGFDPRATSPAGAVGLWQFMPTTAEVYGLTRSSMLDERRNPFLATRAAAHHLRDLFLRFGTWDLALAAYNMGYEQLTDAVDLYGTSDLAELGRREAIPSETAAYVPKIAAAALIANNLEHFGFDNVDLAPPVEAGEVAVPAGTSLRLVATAAGVTTSVIRALNPDLLRDRVPNGRGDRLVLVPVGAVSQVRAALPAMIARNPSSLTDAAILEPVSTLERRELLERRLRRRSYHEHESADGGSSQGLAGKEAPDKASEDDDPRASPAAGAQSRGRPRVGNVQRQGGRDPKTARHSPPLDAPSPSL